MENTNYDKQNYNAIDLTKFICSILVVAIHIQPFGNNVNFRFLNYGIQNYLARIAVPFFFVTSGFLLYRKTVFENFSIEKPLKYVLKLFRLYVIWSLIYLPLNIKTFISGEKGVIHFLLEYVRNFIFTGSYTQLWYLNATIFAVVLITILLLKHIVPKKIIICAAVFYFFGLFAQSYFGIIEPLRNSMPNLWNILKLFSKVIVTTRNGLFEGFLFVGIGMFFAFYHEKFLNCNRGRVIAGFVISMLLMFGETVILKYFNFVRARDMYLFLVPATIFLFCIVYNLHLKDNKIYQYLRILSSLIFYMHLWIFKIVNYILKKLNVDFENSMLCFMFTIIIIIICSVIMIKLSNTHRFKWMKKLYS